MLVPQSAGRERTPAMSSADVALRGAFVGGLVSFLSFIGLGDLLGLG
jgi:hypothetical protein